VGILGRKGGKGGV